MIELTIDAAGLRRLEQKLTVIAMIQMPFAISRAVNDCAQAATRDVNAAMREIFDRPMAFTERASVAPRALAATKESPIATITFRPIQAKYLALEETGGTRTGAMNTRKPSKTVLVPSKIALDAFGNIPRNTLSGFQAKARAAARAAKRRKAIITTPPEVFLPASAPGNKAGIAGWFRRLDGHKFTRLTAFEAQTHYHARMHYHARVEAAVRKAWPAAIQRRLREAIASAR